MWLNPQIHIQTENYYLNAWRHLKTNSGSTLHYSLNLEIQHIYLVIQGGSTSLEIKKKCLQFLHKVSLLLIMKFQILFPFHTVPDFVPTLFLGKISF